MSDFVNARQCLLAQLSLGIPVVAGVLWMNQAGAPLQYVLTNLAALAVASAWIMLGREPASKVGGRSIAVVLVLLMVLPLLIGPRVFGVARWIQLGPLAVHVGLIAIPTLAILAARERRVGVLTVATLVAAVQPDAASVLAIASAAALLAAVQRDWKWATLAAAGVSLAIVLGWHDTLPPQRFVEHVFIDAGTNSVVWAVLLPLAFIAGLTLLAGQAPADRETRLVTPAVLIGFTVASLLGPYPTPLVGYGVSSILGFGVALGIGRPRRVAVEEATGSS